MNSTPVESSIMTVLANDCWRTRAFAATPSRLAETSFSQNVYRNQMLLRQQRKRFSEGIGQPLAQIKSEPRLHPTPAALYFRLPLTPQSRQASNQTPLQQRPEAVFAPERKMTEVQMRLDALEKHFYRPAFALQRAPLNRRVRPDLSAGALRQMGQQNQRLPCLGALIETQPLRQNQRHHLPAQVVRDHAVGENACFHPPNHKTRFARFGRGSGRRFLRLPERLFGFHALLTERREEERAERAGSAGAGGCGSLCQRPTGRLLGGRRPLCCPAPRCRRFRGRPCAEAEDEGALRAVRSRF